MHQHNQNLREVDRVFNSHYNSLFIEKYGFLCDTENAVDLHGTDGAKKGFISYMTAWLSNIDRLMSMLMSSYKEFRPSDYDLVDLGGGKSISTIYLSHIYNFKSSTSIEIHPKLIEDGKKNLNLYAAREGKNLKINFIQLDVQEFILQKSKYVFFAFNPFEWVIFEKFLMLNSGALRGSESILLYANDRCINQILEHSTLLARDSYYNLSVVKF